MTTEERDKIIKSDKQFASIQILSGMDSHGNQSMMLHWWDEDYHLGPMWRGQCFRCPIETVLKQMRPKFKIRIFTFQGYTDSGAYVDENVQTPLS